MKTHNCLWILWILAVLFGGSLAAGQAPPPAQGGLFEFTLEGTLVRVITSPYLTNDMGAVVVIPTRAAQKGFVPGNILVGQGSFSTTEITEFTTGGSFVRRLSGPGSGRGANEFHFRADGSLLVTRGAGYDGIAVIDASGGESRFAYQCCPHGLTEDHQGNVYSTMTSTPYARLHKWSPTGGSLGSFGWVSPGGYRGLELSSPWIKARFRDVTTDIDFACERVEPAGNAVGSPGGPSPGLA